MGLLFCVIKTGMKSQPLISLLLGLNVKQFVLEGLKLLSDVALVESVHCEAGSDTCQKDLF